MSQEVNLWGGYVSDTDKALEASGGSALIFGLNQGVSITKFEFSTLTGAGGSQGNPALIIEVEIAGSKTNTRIYEPNKVYNRKGEEITDKNSDEYKKGLGQQIMSTKGLLVHWVKGLGIKEEAIEAAFRTTPPTNFETLVKIFENLAKPVLSNKIDLFLHYQKSLRSGADRTFLEIPGNLAFGGFVTSAKPGTFTQKDSFNFRNEKDEVEVMEGLGYENENGKQHPFKRDKKYMESTRAKAQTAQALPGMNPLAQGGFAPQAGVPAPQQEIPQGNQASEEEW